MMQGPLEFIFDAECLENGLAAEDCRTNYFGSVGGFRMFPFYVGIVDGSCYYVLKPKYAFKGKIDLTPG
jgi:hypothetical protein